jgi:hypothetical protein
MSHFVDPFAFVQELAQTHNVEQNGLKGVRFDVKVRMYFAKAVPCQLDVYFWDEAANLLPAIAPGYSDQSGHMCTYADFVPDTEDTVVTVSAFMPYQAISTAPGVTGAIVGATVWSLARHKFLTLFPHKTYLTVTNGPADPGTQAQVEQRLKNALYRDLVRRIHMLKVMSATDRIVFETLMRIAENIYPNHPRDPTTGLPI